MVTFASLINHLNSATKRGRPSIKISTNNFLELILSSLYKHQFISSFFVNKKEATVTIFFRYKQGQCAFSEIKTFSTPSRMLSLNKHNLLLKSKKSFQEYFFFTTAKGIRAYTFFDIIFLKEKISLGFLLFSVRC